MVSEPRGVISLMRYVGVHLGSFIERCLCDVERDPPTFEVVIGSRGFDQLGTGQGERTLQAAGRCDRSYAIPSERRRTNHRF